MYMYTSIDVLFDSYMTKDIVMFFKSSLIFFSCHSKNEYVHIGLVYLGNVVFSIPISVDKISNSFHDLEQELSNLDINLTVLRFCV